MPTISKTMCIEMGHRLQFHEGKCRNLHGHSYKIEVFVDGDMQAEGPSLGMVVDFAELKKAMAKIDEDFDHRTCLQFNDPLLRGLISTYTEERQEQAQALLYATPYLILDTGDTEKDCRQKYVVLTLPPTAEVLANVWLDIIRAYFKDWEDLSFGIKVWETATSCVEI